MVYNLYPAVDNGDYQFPPVVRQALAISPELRNTVIPMTEVQRNDLTGTQLWNGRLIFNTTSNKINRYDGNTLLWYEIDIDKLSKDGGFMLGPITLAGDPTNDYHAATKQYVDARSRYGRNRIINGGFSVNQRGFTSTTTSATYGFDRWRFAYTGGTSTHSTQTPALGELPESARAFARIVSSGQSAAGDLTYYQQRIESVRSLSGKTVTVSFWAKAASGTPKVAVELTQNFGTGGSPSTEVNNYAGQITLSTAWTRYSVTITLPAISGKTLGTDGNDFLGLFLWTSAGSTYNTRTGSLGIQNTTIDFWGVQVEEGSVATPFEQKSYADELRACQRYYTRFTYPNAGNTATTFAWVGAAQTTTTTTDARMPFLLPTTMRAAPTGSVSSVSHFTYYNGGSISAMNNFSQGASPQVGALSIAHGTLSAGSNIWIVCNSTSGWIDFSAEL